MPSYEEELQKFEGYNTQVLGISIDHVPCLKAWAETLGGISYPLLSDFWPHGAVAQLYGVLRADGRSERALFVVDKDGIVRYVDIHEIGDKPDNEEVYKVLRQLEPGAVLPFEAKKDEPKPEPVVAPAGSKNVVMYCRPGCIDCRLARRFLAQNGVAFSEVNALATPEVEARVRAWTGGPLISPVFDIDGTIVIDFQRLELIKVLGLEQAKY
jgi:glutaredoxin